MGENSRYNILVVDDDSRIRESISMLLKDSGYNVETAIHGLDALNKLKLAAPDLIMSDLNMPEMSGFEFLSVVRSRFPQIPVIAMSGMTRFGDQLPPGVFADMFYGKGRSRPDELLLIVARLTRTSPARPISNIEEGSALQQPRYQNLPNGATCILLTCPECLRDLSIEMVNTGRQEFREM